MKVRKLLKRLYGAILRKDKKAEKQLYAEATQKSLKGKKTQVIQ